MMAAIFATMLLALSCAYFGPPRFSPRLAVIVLLACLALSTGLFLFEIYNPDYVFRMPWLQVNIHGGAVT